MLVDMQQLNAALDRMLQNLVPEDVGLCELVQSLPFNSFQGMTIQTGVEQR